MKKNILKYGFVSLLGLGCLTLESCSDWLDVKPKTEVEAEDLFSTEEGFKGALSGVYTAMNQPSLYGTEMTFGFMDAIAQYWKIGTNHRYTDAVKYEYESVTTRMIVDDLWSDSYNVIANANNILAYIDKSSALFTGDNKDIIKGETLAIRAMMHFDLLRLFTPYDQSGDGIPYVDEITKNVTVSSSPASVLEFIVQDLKEAAKYLKNDPILTGRDVTTEDDNGYLINRNYHMNYYAVMGLLARVELYAGHTTEARNYAMEVVNAHNNDGKFPWVTREDANAKEKKLRDRTFSSEHLFALNIKKLTKYIEPYFTATSRPLLCRLNMFGASEIDFRQNFFEQPQDVYVANVPSKLWQFDGSYVDGEFKSPKKDRMPMIRLSEMYYILAECDKADPAKAIKWLNEVLIHRGYVEEELLKAEVIDNPEKVQEQILKEYEREMICEGQLFFYHKRMGNQILNDKEVKYVLPKPESENEFGK